MAIKEILDKIKTVLGADAPAEAIALLADANREANDILDSLSSANKESAQRKAKIRELEASLADANAEAEKAKDPKTTAELKRLKDIEAKYTAHMAEAETAIRNSWAEKEKIISVDKSSKLYDKIEKVKGKFAFPEKDQALPIDIVKRNLETFELLESINYFTSEQTPAGGNPPAGNGNPMPGNSGQAYIAEIKTK